MLKNDPKIGCYLCFEILSLIFAGKYLSKSWYWCVFYCTNLLSVEILACSWVKTIKDCRILWSCISLDGMIGSYWFLHIDRVRRRKKLLRGFWRVAVSLKIWNEIQSEKKRLSIHFKFTVYYNKPFHQLEISKDRCFFFFLCMLEDTQMRKVLKKNGVLGLAGIGAKWKYWWCFDLLLLKLHIWKYALFWMWDNLHHFRGSVSFREATNHPATFTKINLPPQIFLCFIKDKWSEIAKDTTYVLFCIFRKLYH